MSNSPVRHVSWESLPKEALKPGLSRNWVNGEKGMLAHIYFDKGVVVPKHSHENEQFAYVLEGALLFRIGDDQSEEVVVRAGESYIFPPTFRTAPKRSRTRWISTCSCLPGRTG